MSNDQKLIDALLERGVSRRSFLKFCSVTATSLALTGQQIKAFADALTIARKPTVIWLSFQQCTGCSESILRSFGPALSIENLILNVISLDYHETLQVAAGYQAEQARKDAMEAAKGEYILIVDGSIPYQIDEFGNWVDTSFWSAAAGNSNLASLQEAVNDAALVIALGTCATFGGIPAAYPNPTGALGYGDLLTHNPPLLSGTLPPYVNISGCPPMAEVITGTIAWYLANKDKPDFGTLFADLIDGQRRPKPYYGGSVHDTCPRLGHYLAGEFADSYDDAKARNGWCLRHLGCRGPETFNACTLKGWNIDPKDAGKYGTFLNSPIHAGHNCLGCSEPRFWDKGLQPDGTFHSSFYRDPA